MIQNWRTNLLKITITLYFMMNIFFQLSRETHTREKVKILFMNVEQQFIYTAPFMHKVEQKYIHLFLFILKK